MLNLLVLRRLSGTSNFLSRQGSRAVAATGKLRRGIRAIDRYTGLSKSKPARDVAYVSKITEKKLRKASGMLDEDIKNKRERVFDSCVINIFVTGDLVYVKSRSDNNINKWIYSAAYVVDGTHPYYNVKYIRTGCKRPEKFIVKGIKYENMYWLGWARDRFISAKTMKIGMRMARMAVFGGILPFVGGVLDGAVEALVENLGDIKELVENPELLGDKLMALEDIGAAEKTEKENQEKEAKKIYSGDSSADPPISGLTDQDGFPSNEPDYTTDPIYYNANGDRVDPGTEGAIKVTYREPEGDYDPQLGHNKLSIQQYKNGHKSIYEHPDYIADQQSGDWATKKANYETYLTDQGLNPNETVSAEYIEGNVDKPLSEAKFKSPEAFTEWYGNTDDFERVET